MDRYFLLKHGGERYPPLIQTWSLRGREAIRLGITNPREGPNTYVGLLESESLEGALRRIGSAWFADGYELAECTLPPGQYYKRIARPTGAYPHDPISYPDLRPYESQLATFASQLFALTRTFTSICQTVQPATENLNVYGHDIRNLLVLASTEVEAQWKAILRANGVEQARLDRRDYKGLLDALRLDEYEIGFPFYPWLEPMRPFAEWRDGTLRWYTAYNNVKHGREEFFPQATLENAAMAMLACVVMFVAQFGNVQNSRIKSELFDFFRVVRRPKWLLGRCI